MTDIITTNLDDDQDSPKLARVELLETVTRVNLLTRAINAIQAELLVIQTNLSVSGDMTLAGNLQVDGTLSFSSEPGVLGQVMASQGPGQPTTWVNPTKYTGSSTSNLVLDDESPKTITVEPGLSYSAGQAVVVANDATHYMEGTVQSYDPVTGELTFENLSQVGTGTFAAWTANLTGKAGTSGTSGATWFNGASAPNVATGVNGDYYINTINGDYYQKQSNSWTLLGNLTGPGGSGGTALSTVYDTTSRYQVSTTTGLGATVVSSASIKTGVAWTRTGTSLVITHANHGRSVGERAIVRNTNVEYFDSLITAVDGNTYTVTTTDTGATSGSAGAYSMGFTFAYIGAPNAITGCQIFAPANWDCVLLSARLHMAANTRAGQTHNVTVPKGNINGVGPQTSMDAVTIPTQQVRQDGNTLSAVGNTLAVNLSGDFGVYQFGALANVAVGIHILMNF